MTLGRNGFAAAALGALIAGTVVGCPGNLDNPDRFPIVCDAPAALKFYCSGSNCHSSDHVANGTTLVLIGEYGEQYSHVAGISAPDKVGPDASMLKDLSATYQGVLATDKGKCSSPPEKIINTAKPEDSLILKKLAGHQSCGLQMPYSGVKLHKDSYACLQSWALGLAGVTDAGALGAGGTQGGGGSGGTPGSGGADSGVSGAAGTSMGGGGGI